MKKIGSYGGATSGLTGFGGGFTKKKRFYIEDGSNLYRILPPFGSNAETGAIAKYHAVYWLKNSAGKKYPVPSQLRVGRNKEILQRDPLFDAIAEKNNDLQALEKAGGDQALIDAMKEELKGLNLDKAYYVNAMNVAGEIGVLKVKATAWTSLKQRLKELEQQSIDPINIGPGNGIVFDFKRWVDEKNKTNYEVSIASVTVKDPSTGRARSEYQYMELDEQVYERMEKEAEDLSNLYRVFTPEEQALLATLDIKTWDRVLQRPKNNDTQPTEADPADGTEGDDTTYTAPEKTATTQATAKQETKQEVKQEVKVEKVETKTVVEQSTPNTAYTGPAAGTSDKVKSFLASRKAATPSS